MDKGSLTDLGIKAIEQLKNQVKFLLGDKFLEEKAEEIANILTEGRWTHDYPITFDEAKRLGLKVSKEIPDELYQQEYQQ